MDEALRKSLDKFGSHFIVASMVPSLAFVIILIIVFVPGWLFPVNNVSSPSLLIEIFNKTLILLIPTIIIGFTLSVLNTYIFKIFEGYSVFWRIYPLIKQKRDRADLLFCQIDQIRRRIIRLEKRGKSRRAKNELPQLRDKYYSLVSKYDQSYPYNKEDILPTNFGNKLRASETYPQTRYGIDSVAFWPRLIQVIPDKYQNYIDQSRNEVSFLLNCSVLSIFFSLICTGIFIYKYLSTEAVFTFDKIFEYPWLYIILVIISWVVTFLFYFFANNVVSVFGMMIRSAYDLFRLDLLKHLKLKIPQDSHEEFYRWKNLGEFIVLGQQSLELEKLEYDIKD